MKGGIANGEGAGADEEKLAILLLRAGLVVVRELGLLRHCYLCLVSLIVKRQGCVCILEVVEGFVLLPILLCNPIQELCAILLILGVVPLILLKGQVVPLLFIQCGLAAVAGQILRKIVASDESGRVEDGPANHDSNSRHCVYMCAHTLTGSILLLKELSDEVEHYRQVAKKYKRSHSMVHTSAVGLGSLSVGLSSGALATALTRFGVVASPALAGVATLCGLASVGFAAASKRLNRKVTKHENIYTLAQEKRNSVNELVSQALADKQISDVEFRIITREVDKYQELKAAIRAGGQSVVTQETATQTQAPDLEKLKEELRKEVKLEFQKKVNLLTAVSKSDLNG